MAYSHLLAPTDMSEPSFVALRSAVELAQRFEAKLTLLHVVVSAASPENIDWRDATKMQIGLADRETIESEKDALEALAAQHVPDGMKCNTEVLYGEAAEEIVGLAKSERVDLIVMATHGRTGWRRLIYGSVTQEVLKEIPCPVLCIPRPDK